MRALDDHRVHAALEQKVVHHMSDFVIQNVDAAKRAQPRPGARQGGRSWRRYRYRLRGALARDLLQRMIGGLPALALLTMHFARLVQNSDIAQVSLRVDATRMSVEQRERTSAD